MSRRTCFGFRGPPIRPRGAREQSSEGPFLTTTHKLSERSPKPDSSSIGHENSGPTSVPRPNNSRPDANLLRSACCAGSRSGDRLSPKPVSTDVRAARFYVHRVEGLPGGHEEAVALRTAETDVGADFRQQ